MRFTLVFGILLVCFSPNLWSSVPEELPAPQKVIPDTATELQRKAAILAQQGQKEEADQLMAKARDLLRQARARNSEAAAGPGVDRQGAEFAHQLELARVLQVLREKLVKASEPERAEIRMQMARVEQEYQRLQSGPAPDRGLDEATKRIRHLRMAAENLKAAGNPDLATQLTKQADEMERAVKEARERQARPEGLAEQVQALRLEVKQLRAEVEELKKQISQRSR